MQIELQVKSPEMKLAGFDQALEKLRLIEESILRLSQMAKLDLNIKVNAPGLNKLRTDLAGMESNAQTLAEALEQAGKSGMVGMGHLSGDAATAREALEKMRTAARDMGDELSVASLKSLEMRQKFGKFQERNQTVEGFSDVSEREGRALKMLQAQEDATRRLAAQHAAMQRAIGLGEAMSGSSRINETAAAEEKLGAVQGGVVAGMEAQTAAAAAKAKRMAALKTEVAGVAAVEKSLESAVGGSAAAMVDAEKQAAELSRTTKTLKGVSAAPTIVTRGDLPGEKITSNEATGLVTSQIDHLEALKRQIADAERGASGRWKAEGANPADKPAMLRGQQQEVARLLAATHLHNEEWVQGKLVANAALEAEAAGLERTMALQAEKTALLRNDRNVRREAAQIERNYGASTHHTASADERVVALRAQAQEMRQLLTGAIVQNETWAQGKLRLQDINLQLAQAIEQQAVLKAQQVAGMAGRAQGDIARFQQMQRDWGAVPNTRTQSDPGGGRRDVSEIERVINGRKEIARLTVDYDQASRAMNGTLMQSSHAFEAVEDRAGGYGKALLNSIVGFSRYVLASGSVLAALALLRRGFSAFMEIEHQTAVLRSVFNGTQADADALRDSVLSLAVANGRSSDEAMDAAIRWARIGLSTRQTAEMVAVSLEAANVAEITAAQAAEQLSAIYASFGQSLAGPRVALNEMNAISNAVNFTVKDLMSGLARVGPLAHAAGLSISETLGILAAAGSRTGRSGSEIGNALKALIAATSNPAIQEKLPAFGVEVKTEGGDLKGESEIIGELFTAYNKLSDAERQEMLVKIGGKQQASRLAAMMESYVKGQELAIMAQLDLNSADREATRIRGTVLSQLSSLGAAFNQLASDMANAGGEESFSSNLKESIQLITLVVGALDRLKGSPNVPGLKEGISAISKPGGVPWMAAKGTAGLLGRWIGGDTGEAIERFQRPVSALIHYFEGLGTEEEKSRRALAGYNEELERMRGVSGAVEQRMRLARTLSMNIGRIAERSPEAARANLEQFANVSAPGDAAKQEAIRAELVGLLAQNRLKELSNRLDEIGKGMQSEKTDARLKELAILQRSRDALKADLARETAATKTGSAEARAAAAKEALEIEAKITANLGEQNTKLGEIAETDIAHADAMSRREKIIGDRIKSRIDTGEKLGDAMPVTQDTATAKLERENQVLDANIERTKERIALYTAETNAALAASQARLKPLEEERKAQEAMGVRYQNLMDSGSPGMAAMTGFQPKDLERATAAEKAAMAEARAAGSRYSNQLEQERLTQAELEARKQITAELKEQEAVAKDQITEGMRAAKNLGLSSQTGRNEAEKGINEFNALNPFGDKVEAWHTNKILAGETDNPFRDQARVQEQVNLMGKELLSTEERRARLAAEIVNLRQKENEEASKSLQMGTREEQLRAAGLAKFSQERGGRALSGSEFQFLDKETRESITKTNPNLAPDELKSPVRDAEAQIRLIDANLDRMKETFESINQVLKDTIKPAQVPNTIDAGRPPAPQINPTFNVTLGNEFGALAETLTLLVQNDLARVEGKVNGLINARGAVADAQSAGQLANA